MSQPSVTAFFNSRKRQANEEIRNKAKVLIIERTKNSSSDAINKDSRKILEEKKKETEQEPSSGSSGEAENAGSSSPKLLYVTNEDCKTSEAPTERSGGVTSSVVRNIQFDQVKSGATMTKAGVKTATKPRAARSRKFSTQEGQTDIRETFLKMSGEATAKEGKCVPFEKMGALSPKKRASSRADEAKKESEKEKPAAGSTTPKKRSAFVDRLARQELSLGDIKNRIIKSSRLAELKASIDRLKKCDDKIKQMESRENAEKLKIKKFERIELEVPVSPSKTARSPSKSMLSPTKTIKMLENASPQRKLLFESKAASPVKTSPTKVPAYQRYQSLADSATPALPLPYNYRFLAEAFRCLDTVSAMLFNRKEVITFRKLKPAVQELLRRNFTLEHLAQIKTIYPDAYVYNQEKLRNFGSASKQDRYELVLIPTVDEKKSGRNTPDSDNVLKSASETNMGPTVMLERRRKFYNILLERVKAEHETFLLNLENPMRIPKEKINRWHPEFDVEKCRAIEQAELPQPPNVEKAQSAKDVLEKAKSLFNCNTRMEKALQRLAETKMTSKSVVDASTITTSTKIEDYAVQGRNVEISVVDTPPATPTTQNTPLSAALKGIPKALLERVRAKQAARALEAITRTPTADREAAIYSRLPEMAKILRSIYVAEKKGVLPLETVLIKLDNSYRTKLTPNELEEHVRIICKLLPTFACVQKVRQVDYLKIAKTADIVKVVKRLEIMANDKVNV